MPAAAPRPLNTDRPGADGADRNDGTDRNDDDDDDDDEDDEDEAATGRFKAGDSSSEPSSPPDDALCKASSLVAPD